MNNLSDDNATPADDATPAALTESEPALNHYVEIRKTADLTMPGSRWERIGASTDETTARAEFEARKATGLDVRLVRLDWDPDGDGDDMPLTTVVNEAVRS